MLAAAFFATAGTPADAHHRCWIRGAEVLASSPEARVFRRGTRNYGCLFRTNRRVRLEPDNDYAGIEFRLAGAFVAYEAVVASSGGTTAWIRVVDLRTGTEAHRSPGVTYQLCGNRYGHDEVSRLRAHRRGAATWIGERRDDRGGVCLREVRKADAEGNVVLDTGGGIARRSLRLRGEQIGWRKDGRAYGATLVTVGPPA